jgi:hypothetical protein
MRGGPREECSELNGCQNVDNMYFNRRSTSRKRESKSEGDASARQFEGRLEDLTSPCVRRFTCDGTAAIERYLLTSACQERERGYRLVGRSV